MRQYLHISVLGLALIGCATTNPPSDAHFADQRAIQNIVDAYAGAWNRHDMKTFSELCTEDADYVVRTGKHLKGREEILAHHEPLHKEGRFRDREMAAQLKDLRFIHSGVAIGHIAFVGRATSGDEKQTTALATVVFTKKGGSWLIAAFHNTLLSGPPELFLPLLEMTSTPSRRRLTTRWSRREMDEVLASITQQRLAQRGR